MNKQQAMRELKRILGKRLMWREDPDAPVGEVREAAIAIATAARDASREASDAVNARSKALLAGDAEFQRLAAVAGKAREAMEKTRGAAHRHRITVGTDEGFAFAVKAQGDNWQDVVDQLKAKGSRS